MVFARTAPSIVLLAILAGCAGGGAAARGCSAGCRSGSTVARSSHAIDDVARSLARSNPGRIGLKPLVVPGAAGRQLVEHAGERIAMTGLEDAARALPKIEGQASTLARVPSARGARMVAKPGAARSLADDYARSIDSLRLSRHQHEKLLDAFDLAQNLLDVATSAGDDSSDEPLRELAERARIQRTAATMARRIERVLDDEQARQLYAALGTPQVITFRLARERPMTRAADADANPAPIPAPAAP
jgi:hypothetical protein